MTDLCHDDNAGALWQDDKPAQPETDKPKDIPHVKDWPPEPWDVDKADSSVKLQGGNGAVRTKPVHMQSTSIVGRNGGTLTPIRDSERARQLAYKRHEAAHAARRKGVAAAAGQSVDLERFGYDLDNKTGQQLAMLAHISEAHAMNAADPSSRGSTASARMTFELYEPDKTQAQQPSPGGMTLSMDGETAQQVLALLRELVGNR